MDESKTDSPDLVTAASTWPEIMRFLLQDSPGPAPAPVLLSERTRRFRNLGVMEHHLADQARSYHDHDQAVKSRTRDLEQLQRHLRTLRRKRTRASRATQLALQDLRKAIEAYESVTATLEVPQQEREEHRFRQTLERLGLLAWAEEHGE